MKKIYSFFLMLALTCVSTAWAYDVNITSDPENNYFSGSQSFPIADIISGLGLADEEALADLISNTNAVYIKPAEGEPSNAYTGNHNEFWMNTEGVAQGYGDEGTCWYAGIYYSPAGVDPDSGDEYDSEFFVKVGQMPNFFKKIYTDSDLACVLRLYNGNGFLEFNVNLHVNAAPQPTEVYLSQLTIVADYTLPLNFTIGKSYEGKTYSATLEGVYEALGTTAEEFDAKASAQTYAQTVKTIIDAETQETSYELIDSLSHPDDAAADGWFGRYANFDEASGKEIPLEINAPHAWAAGCTFYTQGITLAEGEYSITSGQYPGTFTSTEDKDFTYLYLVNGDKAARIKVQVAMEEAPDIDPSEWEEVGDTTIVQSTNKFVDYLTIASNIVNIDDIAAALECEPEDITYYHYSTGDGFDNSIDDSGINGAWLDEEGHKCAWGSDAAIMICYKLNDGVYQISSLQMPISMSEKLYDGVELAYPVFLVNEASGKYYTVNINYSVNLPASQKKQADWTKEGELEYDVQLIPKNEYPLDQKTEVDVEYIKNVMEVDDINQLVLFGDIYYENPEEADPDKLYTSQLTLTPEGGFWMMSKDGQLYPSSWGNSDALGMDWQNSGEGIISWWNKPGTRSVGDTYKGNFYLVDMEAGKYFRIVCNIEFVDEIGPTDEPLGESNVTFSLAADKIISDGGLNDGLYQSDPVDWEPVFEALGITEDNLETAEWMVQSSSGKFIVYGATDVFVGEDALMDKNGRYVNIGAGGNIDDAVFAIAFDLPSKSFAFSLLGEEIQDDVTYSTKVALKAEAGTYVFNIYAASAATIVGVNAPKTTVTIDKFIDMNGREVPAPVKGNIYINSKLEKVVY